MWDQQHQREELRRSYKVNFRVKTAEKPIEKPTEKQGERLKINPVAVERKSKVIEPTPSSTLLKRALSELKMEKATLNPSETSKVKRKIRPISGPISGLLHKNNGEDYGRSSSSSSRAREINSNLHGRIPKKTRRRQT